MLSLPSEYGHGNRLMHSLLILNTSVNFVRFFGQIINQIAYLAKKV